jgi:transcriptional/translational regulatory protein YebC/TACO1
MEILVKMESLHLSSTEKEFSPWIYLKSKWIGMILKMEMIDGGAEDVEKDEDEVMITTAFEDFGSLSHKLDELKIEAKSAELQRIPNNIKEVNEEQFKANMKMLERFEDDDDVQNVYHNMEISEELMNSL